VRPPAPTTPRAPVQLTSPRRRSLRPLVWLLLIVLLGVAAFVLGTQAGAITALVQSPLPTSSTRAAPTTAPKTTAKPATTAPRTTSAAPTPSGTALALQVTVQGVSQVLAGLPSGSSKDKLVAEWSTAGAAVLRGDHPNDQLDGFAANVQHEVRKGGISIPQGVAILGAVEAVRAAL
jgi:hypothetical protein